MSRDRLAIVKYRPWRLLLVICKKKIAKLSWKSFGSQRDFATKKTKLMAYSCFDMYNKYYLLSNGKILGG